MKVIGYSHAQSKRLIQPYRKTGTVIVKSGHRNGFRRQYSDADIRLLATMDEHHNHPSGPVLKKLCERAWQRFGQGQLYFVRDDAAHVYRIDTGSFDHRPGLGGQPHQR